MNAFNFNPMTIEIIGMAHHLKAITVGTPIRDLPWLRRVYGYLVVGEKLRVLHGFFCPTIQYVLQRLGPTNTKSGEVITWIPRGVEHKALCPPPEDRAKLG